MEFLEGTVTSTTKEEDFLMDFEGMFYHIVKELPHNNFLDFNIGFVLDVWYSEVPLVIFDDLIC